MLSVFEVVGRVTIKCGVIVVDAVRLIAMRLPAKDEAQGCSWSRYHKTAGRSKCIPSKLVTFGTVWHN